MAVTQTHATDENASIESLSDRETRALTEVMSTLDDQGAVADNPSLYEVVSSSGKSYAVDLGGDEPRCTCADHLHRGKVCKHIHRVMFATGIRHIPADFDQDELDDQLGEHVTEGQPRIAMTDGGVAAHQPSSERKDPRDDYILIGTDADGGDHIYRTKDEHVLVVEDGEVTQNYDLEDHDATVNEWIDYVETKIYGGFESQYLFKTMGDWVSEAI
ncbi:hypothetical protein [Natrialba aegyptia]|uniref:hypothetical protein n=1 Tax=Natrialba aegyptia TaxID=129789 RepID=UPI00403B1A89